ncbi:hypothetical protein [Candidatus Neomicrothrix sp.]|uniref:hypothetical protein n=1 Tax=Candidatus Neomicrothrix sp. TaxID=2719034 RepID=UPI002597FDB5|nr:hypothetical protein [Candidatus Microthrix sp.]HMS48741.1 hypothetical protein [Candidatus Microthrix sp.]
MASRRTLGFPRDGRRCGATIVSSAIPSGVITMPSLWTPDGERNVERESPAPAAEPTASSPPPAGGPGAAAGGGDDMALSATELKAQAEQLGIDLDSLSPEERAQAEAAVVEMAATRARLAETPAAEVIANHLMGFYELGAIHLSRQPPAFEDAALAIDALRAVLERVGDRLGEAGAVLNQAQTQIQMAFVQVKDQHAAATSGTAAGDAAGGGEAPDASGTGDA